VAGFPHRPDALLLVNTPLLKVNFYPRTGWVPFPGKGSVPGFVVSVEMTCRRLGIKGISLHSYRYAWAERAKVAGMPERFAQEALGHNCKAVHRAYAKKAQMKIPSLEEYEQGVMAIRGDKTSRRYS
jgi:integrase